MKVLHVASGALYGGVERLLATLARYRELAPDLEQSFALCTEGRLSSELKSLGVAPFVFDPVRVSRPWSVWHARRALKELSVRTRPDWILCHGAWVFDVFGTRAPNIGIAFFAHDAPNRKHWVDRWAAWKRPDRVITNSRFTASQLPAALSHGEPRIYYCPVPAPGSPSAEARIALRTELGLPDNALVVVQASRIEPWKGHTLHLHALAEVISSTPCHSLIVGGPQRPRERIYFERLKTLARELGITSRVHFLGERSDVPELLSAADIMLQPNEGPEPFGIAFIEAMHAGIPVVTFAKGGAAEVITSNCGVLANSRDELVTGLKRLLNDPELRRSMGAAGRERARLLCDPARQLPALKDILE